MTLLVDETMVILKDQLWDYQYRGHDLDNCSLYDFFINTYEEESKAESTIPLQNETSVKAPGRPKNRRIPYLAEAEKPSRCRVERSKGHETMPRFIGKWIPDSSKADSKICMLPPYFSFSNRGGVLHIWRPHQRVFWKATTFLWWTLRWNWRLWLNICSITTSAGM